MNKKNASLFLYSVCKEVSEGNNAMHSAQRQLMDHINYKSGNCTVA